LPIFARLLTPADFGRLDVLNALISASIVALLLGTDVAATRLYFDRDNPPARRQLLSSWYALGIAAISPLAIVLLLAADPISRTLFGTPELSIAVAIVGVVVLAGMAHTITLGVLRATGRPMAYAVLEGGALVANAGLGILLLIAWRADATAVMLALAISWSVAAVLGIWAVRASVASAPSWASAADLLGLGLPLAPAVAATLGADFFNRAYLLGTAGPTDAGYLSIAIRIASVAGLIVVATQLAWQPHAYRLGDAPASLTRLATEARQILAVLSLFVGLLGLLAPEVVAVVGAGRYADARPAVGLALLGVLGTGLFAVTSLRSAMAQSTRDIGLAALAGVAAAVAVNLVLAPSLGAPGTAAAIATGQLLPVGVVAWLGRRHGPLPVDWTRVAAIVTMTVAAVAIGSLFGAPLAVRVIVAVAYLAGLWLEGTVAVAARDVQRWLQDSRGGR
jgi:O-antigen/teichoic acid export membrane protein